MLGLIVVLVVAYLFLYAFCNILANIGDAVYDKYQQYKEWKEKCSNK